MMDKLTRTMIAIGFILLMGAGEALAQTAKIEGTIINEKTSNPIIGANVFIKSIGRGAVTDVNGHFIINNVPYGTYTLRISYIGYKTKQKIINVSKPTVTINQTLRPNILKLNNVVVTAFGVKQKINQLPYSAQKIAPKKLEQNGTGNYLSSLDGRISGLRVQTASGIGGSTSIIIRGFSSLTGNNQALIVVDGVPIINTSYDGIPTAGQATYDLGNSGVDLNANNIASVTVLKGAAAAALYGSRAANGAILIQTKKGAPGQEQVNITVESSGGLSFVDGETLPKFQHKFGAGYVNSFQTISNPFPNVSGDSIMAVRTFADASWGPAFDSDIKVYQWYSFYKDSPHYGEPTPWVAAEHGPRYFFKPGVHLQNSIMINGSIADSSYYMLGYNQTNQRGVMPNSRLKKYQLNFKSGFHISKKLMITGSANFSMTDGVGRPRRGYNSLMTVIRQFGQVNVDYKRLKRAFFRNRRNETWNLAADLSGPLFDDNPYWDRYVNYESDQRKNFRGFAKAKYDIFNWLNLTARIAVNNINEFYETRINVGSEALSNYSRNQRVSTQITTDFLLHYNKQVTKKLSMNGVIGAHFRRLNVKGIFASTNGGLNVPGVYSLSNSVAPINYPDETANKLGVNAYFVSLNLHYNNFLAVALTGRRDKSSTLPKNSNVFYYPSASVGFRFNKFLQIGWLSLAKIRGSWAQVGNSAPVHSLVATYNRLPNFGSVALYSLPNRRNDPTLKPEKTKSWEVGLQLGFINNRLTLSGTYYHQNSVNQIIPIPITPSTGFTSRFINSGKIVNRGIGVKLKARPVLSNDFSWQVIANWNKNINKVVSLAPNIDYYQFAALQGGGSIGAVAGGSFGTIRGSDFIYLNGKRVVGSDGNYLVTNSFNNVIGNEIPDWIGGVVNNFRYKNFSLSFLISVRAGGDIYSVDQYYGQDTGKLPITVGPNKRGEPKRAPVSEGGGILKDGVTKNGEPNTTWAAVNFYSGYGYMSNPMAAFVYDGSFVKLKQVTLSYSLPPSLMEELNVFDSITFSAVGRNLWIIHKNIPYTDPEQHTFGNRLMGYQNSVFPAVRNITFSIKLNF